MSPKNPLLTAGLTVLGLFGFAPLGVADPTPPAPSGPKASVAPTPSHAVLLLTNGRLCEGTISENGTDYVVHTKFGTLSYPKRDVEKRAGSVREVYEYLLERLPARDPDEHMKLALWCLNQKMKPEATAQLKEVVKLSPAHAQALSMLEKIGGAEEREAHRDPAFTLANNRPEEFDSALAGRAQRGLEISALPPIPGLPKALGVKRADEFSRHIDPILQNRCSKCHNEQFAGTFQLIRYKTKADRTREARSANLDAVLALIDMENPAKSEFLSTTLRAHGNGANARPIFRGASDQEYRTLSTWVNSLRVNPAPTNIAAQPSRIGTPAPSEGEVFAAGRSGQMPLPPLTPTPASPTAGRFDPSVSIGVPPPAFTAEQLEAIEYQKTHPDVNPGGQFPSPFAVSGARPKLESAPQARAVPPGAPKFDPATGAPLFDPVTGASLNPELPAGSVPSASATPPAVPPAAATAKAASATPKQPVKLDPALLEKALMNRYAP
ncbi:hypothetical protein [Singulisphaera acidiphila]|uniref:Cytochrome c domain-containing protein n=1 Tax=Singulisphaera acidiphila (strain ATCC BAA-1392 / DSM 18658 / VKM B-2454 / MOB10) TaxID=886293 RepID=L0DH58_SINAD|nr:hypothetical protein [Singulisphaera acidiphila]AGA28001.1 hypothetical protein Sinac_3765 [Singulisphaera acidiphila DSM 18658]